MSLSVKNLTRKFGNQTAVDGLSFEARPGEILGFLGPNGAGKSTTMKMLTCYLTPTSGTAEVCGYDIIKSPEEIKRKTGYLPESNPLYTDMYIREYLMFTAGIYKLGRHSQKKVDDIIERVGLTPERDKLIGQLSKGYRQRVGLAQALIHEPEVLILDEPTSGLDPNQVVEIRNLIQEYGKTKTVIFSTHILQEVKAICQRVVIINKGKLAADSYVSDLSLDGTSSYIYLVQWNKKVDISALQKITEIKKVQEVHEGTYRIWAIKDIRESLFQFTSDQLLDLMSFVREQDNLENIFRHYTEEKPREDKSD